MEPGQPELMGGNPAHGQGESGGVWNWAIFKIPSNPDHSMILLVLIEKNESKYKLNNMNSISMNI